MDRSEPKNQSVQSGDRISRRAFTKAAAFMAAGAGAIVVGSESMAQDISPRLSFEKSLDAFLKEIRDTNFISKRLVKYMRDNAVSDSAQLTKNQVLELVVGAIKDVRQHIDNATHKFLLYGKNDDDKKYLQLVQRKIDDFLLRISNVETFEGRAGSTPAMAGILVGASFRRMLEEDIDSIVRIQTKVW